AAASLGALRPPGRRGVWFRPNGPAAGPRRFRASSAPLPPPSAAEPPACGARSSPPNRRLANRNRSSELLLGRPQGCAELACGARGELGLGLPPPRPDRAAPD